MESARIATPDDLARLVELAAADRAEQAGERGGALWLAREARPGPLHEALGALLGADDARVVAGCIDGVVVGYGVAEIEQLHDATSHGVVTDLYVEPDARGVGVGEAVARLLVSELAATGCTTVDAHALPGARQAKNFFEAHGFTARLIVMSHRLLAPWPDPEVPT